MTTTTVHSNFINNAGRFLAADGSVSLSGGYSPSNDADLATKGYADQIMEALAPKEAVRLVESSSDASLAGMAGFTHDGKYPNDDDRVLLTAQSAASENGIYDTNLEMIPLGDVELSPSTEGQANVQVNFNDPGTASSALNISFTQGDEQTPHIVDVSLETDGDSIIVSTAQEVSDAINGATTTDADGNDVISAAPIGGSESNVQSAVSTYLAVSYARSEDADTEDDLEGASVYVTEGSSHANERWVLSTDPPFTVGSDPLSFVKHSGASTLTGGDGVDISSDTVSADIESGSMLTALAGDGTQLGVQLDSTFFTQDPSLTFVSPSAYGAVGLRTNMSGVVGWYQYERYDHVGTSTGDVAPSYWYTTRHPLPATLKVYVDGVLQRPNGNDYTFDPATDEITIHKDLSDGQVVSASYETEEIQATDFDGV